MTKDYCRSEILSFADLSELEQKQVIDEYFNSSEDAEEDSFVRFRKDILPLSMFMRCERSIFNGVYGTSYFSGYFIKINKSGDEALIADKYF